MLDKIHSVLSEVENSPKPFNELDIHYAIGRLRDKNDTSQPPMEWLAEYMAFGFHENSSEQVSAWGTYFGPLMTVPNGDRTVSEFPSLSQVTPEMLNYWANRAKQAKYPIFKTRYAALVWDFSKKVINQSPNVEMAHICIDSIIEIFISLRHKYTTGVEVINKMQYAVELAIRINDKGRLNRLRDEVIVIGDNSIDDKMQGLLDFSFDTLLMNEKVQLNDEQEGKIINDLELRLECVSNFENKKSFNPFIAEDTSIRLAQYYRKKNKSEDVKRVLLKYGGAFKRISEEASGILAISWLRKVESIYRSFGLKGEADKVLNIIRKRGPDAQKDMKTVKFQQEIPREEMDNYVNAMIEGDINTAMARIAFEYIPKKDEETRQLKDLIKNNPISYLFPAMIQDHNGRTVAQIGSFENDFDGHLVKHIAQGIQFSSVFLWNVLHKFKEKFSVSADSIINELSKSPVFAQEKAAILKKGLDAYFNGDHLVAIHLLIPQVEGAIRRLLELTGGTTYRPSPEGGYQLKILGAMLREEGIVQSLGKDAALYLRILYTDPRGWNLRNDVCHGMSMPEEFCQPIADRVFHTLLLLGSIREHKKEE